VADNNAERAILAELQARGVIDVRAGQMALQRATAEHRPLMAFLIEERFVSERDVYAVLADLAGMPFVEPDDILVDASASELLSTEWARRLRALPYGWNGNILLVAVDDPTNLSLADDLRRLTRVDPTLVLAPPSSLMRKVGQVYRAEDELDDISAVLGGEVVDDIDVRASADAAGETPIIRYVNLLIAQAVADRASDIHLEPTDTDMQVRYRIDGVLHPQTAANKSLHSAVVSRLKIMASMDIAERRVPQDGRLTIAISGRKVDLRVTTLPTVYGEKVILRILDNSSAPLALEEMGLSQYHQDVYREHYVKPHGMILVTGPTGSGKSTTLYATLNAIRSPQVNVITVEDPVEYRMPGVNQVQINNRAGLTFAAALRSILRADPDVVMVGEIRDKETAQIAVEASLTGHMVLTTLHTNDASSAVTRLVEMGIEPYLVGSALSLVVAQRLLRRLCDRCAETYVPDEDMLRATKFPFTPGEPLPSLRRAVGCQACSRTGFRGRTAIHEMLAVTPQIERMANEGAHTDQVREVAIANGMRTMRQDGWEKVLAGSTTIEEVLRVSA
jgi:type IV pilus assembly protein PilB